MIQWIAKGCRFSTSRRAPALVLAALLNLALIPCAMAFEVVEQEHDCCPPELNLESPQCCELDDVNVDKRDGTLKPWDSPDFDDLATDSLGKLAAYASVRRLSVADPPDPPGHVESRHKLFCVYLI
jgi:hypothetical protein